MLIRLSFLVKKYYIYFIKKSKYRCKENSPDNPMDISLSGQISLIINGWPHNYTMLNIRIADYDISVVDQICRLFADIYPDQPDIVYRVCYDPKRHDHISTKVAFWGQEIIGQANIFYHKDLDGNANLGFHVHPSKRSYGIATTLSNEALKDAHSKGISLFYIRTNKDNYAAIAVAKKLGFIPAENKFVENNLKIFEKQL